MAAAKKNEQEAKIYEYENCVICLESLNTVDVVIPKCGHKCCHLNCLTKYMENKGEFKCPVCNNNPIEEEKANRASNIKKIAELKQKESNIDEKSRNFNSKKIY